MPPLTPEQLGEIPVRLEKLTRAFEETVLEDISRRIAKAGSITDTAEWQLIRLKEMGYASEFLEKAAADYTAKSQEEIQQLFFDAGQCSDEFYSEVYSQAGKGFTPLADNQYMQQLIEAGIAQTENELKNFTRSMGFRMKNPDGTVSFKPIAKAYHDALDLAQMQVSTGVFDYNTAVRNAVKTLAESGLRFVDYETGHVNHADVAVRRAVLTGVSQMSGKISESNAAELDTDIVEVTAHAGARPDHAEWQGRWYSLSGKSKKYPSLVEVTGYGTGAGLKGWNCRHDMYPVIEGISVPSYTEEELKNIDPPPVEYDGKTYTYYECTQRQRRIETAIRKTKRELISAKASDDEEMFTAKSILLRRQREEYEKFSSAAGLLTQKERTQAYGFGRSTASKSSWAARKALDKSHGSGIIRVTNEKGIENNMKLFSETHTAAGNRRSPLYKLSEADIKFVQEEIAAISANIDDFVFNSDYTRGTCFLASDGKVHIKGNIFPDEYSDHPRDKMSVRAVLAHEYYGHRPYREQYIREDNDTSDESINKIMARAWADEFRASYMAAKNAPNLSDDDRRLLILDSLSRADEAGISIKYNDFIRRVLYG